jgi:hypothetical protein
LGLPVDLESNHGDPLATERLGNWSYSTAGQESMHVETLLATSPKPNEGAPERLGRCGWSRFSREPEDPETFNI